MPIEDWIRCIDDQRIGASTTCKLYRALKRAARDKVITKQEEKSLWSMIRSSDEDCYVALKALESKYKLNTETNE